jgi:hypothetical protein
LLNEDSELKIEVSPNTPNDTVADALKRCMHESYANAKKIYGGSSGNSCYTVVGGEKLQFGSPPYTNIIEDLVGKSDADKSTHVPGGLVAFNGTNCFESIQVQTDKKSGRTAVAFNDAPLPKYSSKKRFNLRYMALTPQGGRPTGVLPPTLTCYPTAKDNLDTGICDGGNLNQYFITAPDTTCGVVATKDSPTGDGKKKTK